MEELLIILFQFFFEVILQVLAELPWDIGISRREDWSVERPFLFALLSLAFGLLLGGLSLALFPHTFLHHPWLRIANLLVSPLATGGTSWSIASLRKKGSPQVSPGHHFAYSFLFSLAFAAIRFTYALR